MGLLLSGKGLLLSGGGPHYSIRGYKFCYLVGEVAHNSFQFMATFVAS